MEISIKRQLICVLAALVFGVISAVLLGAFRFVCYFFGLRQSRNSGRIKRLVYFALQSFLDLLFCLIVSVGFQLLLYVFDYGRFRLIYLLSGVVGFIIYDKTFGKLTDKLFCIIADFFRKIFSFLFRYLLLPVKLLFSVIGKWICTAVDSVVVSPYRAHVRRKDIKNVRWIIENELTELIKF